LIRHGHGDFRREQTKERGELDDRICTAKVCANGRSRSSTSRTRNFVTN
jgi:hypothetical protein